MSSFKTQLRDKETGELVEVFCRDDYFDRHKYGYLVRGEVLTEEEFMNK